MTVYMVGHAIIRAARGVLVPPGYERERDELCSRCERDEVSLRDVLRLASFLRSFNRADMAHALITTACGPELADLWCGPQAAKEGGVA